MNSVKRFASAVLHRIIQNRVVRNLSFRLARRKIITGFREFCVAEPSQRALVSYLVLPLLPPPALRERVLFSNRGIAQQIVQGLNEMGYLVDIVNYDNLSFQPSDSYDLFVGHAGINFEHISRLLPRHTARIYFSTGIYWREMNVREARRFYDLTLRTGHVLPPDRYVGNPEDYANQVADGIICLGNKDAAKTYARFPQVVNINNGIFPLCWEGWQDKDYGEGRKHFLFFSGRGNVHKGLDRLLEAFAGLDLHLHVCQHLEPDFERVYRQELKQCPNIHVHGFIKMRSSHFESLAQRCNWVILPTCAEGQPGSVIECMAYGLVPILPDAANIDLEDWGVRLPDCEVETIRSEVSRVSTMAVEECRGRAARVVEASKEKYSVENFRSSFIRGVAQILKVVQARA